MPHTCKYLITRWTALLFILICTGCVTQTTFEHKKGDPKAIDTNRHAAFIARESQLRRQREIEAKKLEESVWDTLKHGFSIVTQDDPTAASYEKWLANHPKHIAKLNKRVRLTLPYIVEEIQRRDLPLELALVPMIESSLNTFATSHARAAGLWQIMPATGRWLGLTISSSVDERRNIIESTRVSLEYLAYLADYYDDNWQLGITAYNAGNGNVNKALKRANKSNRYTKPWKLPLVKESKEYYSKIIGLRNYILKTGTKYPALPVVPLENFFTTSRTAPSRPFANIAKQYNTDIEIISYLNADYIRQRTLKNKTTILVPKNYHISTTAEEFAIKEIKPTLIKHKIRSGESLSVIARKYSTTVRKLKRLNNLSGNLIRVGKKLLIPIY